MQLNIRLDDSQITRALAAAPHEVATAIRNAINDTLRDVQKAQKEHIEKTFVLKKKAFLLQSVKIPKVGGFASKDHLQGRIEIDPARDILAKHEAGGDVGSYLGRKNVAIPSRQIRTGKGGGVKAGTALKTFLPFAQVSSTRTKSTQLVGQKGAFFTRVRGKNGDIPVLAQRTGKKGKLRFLYLFVPKKRIRPALQFEATAQRIIPGAWQKNAALAIEHALRRAGLK